MLLVRDVRHAVSSRNVCRGLRRLSLVAFAIILFVGARHGRTLVRVYDLEGNRAAIDALRDSGFAVDVRHDSDAGKDAKASDYPVISVGSAVPPADAVAAIQAARRSMTWLKYVFIQDDPDLENEIFIGAHPDWIKVKQLKPLGKADFDAVEAPRQTIRAFHATVRRFGL